MREKEYKGRVMQTDVPNANGRVYPSESWDNAIIKYNELIEHKRSMGELRYTYEGDEQPYSINLMNVSHLITGIKRVENIIECKLRVIYTPNGKILQSIIDAIECGENLDEIVTFKARGIATLTEDNVVQDDYTLIAIDIFPKE